jgi:hypothetical protein
MEFFCSDPQAMVRAVNVQATLNAFKLQPLYAKTLLAPFGLNVEDAQPDQFVPVQRWLDAMKHLQKELGDFVLRQVGSGVAESAVLPVEFSTVESVLEALDAIYYVNHRGNVGHYHVSRGADGSLTVRCETPYPRQFERGLIEGFIRHPRLTQGRRYTAQFTEAPARSRHTCTVTVRAVEAVAELKRASSL